MGFETTLFYLFGAIAVVASLLVIAQRNPIYGVLLLIASFGALSGLYVLLDAPLVALIQITVYAGAIMVLFLVVVMLLNAPQEDTGDDERVHPLRRHGPMRLGAVLAAAFIVELVWALTKGGGQAGPFPGAAVGSVRAIGRSLFTDYGFAFAVTSVLILVAMVGAVLLARRDSLEPLRPFDRLRVDLNSAEGRGAQAPSNSAGGGAPTHLNKGGAPALLNEGGGPSAEPRDR